MNNFEDSMMVEEEEVSTSFQKQASISFQKLNSPKKWLYENDMKKLDRKTWEKTGARPKSNSRTANHRYPQFSILSTAL